MARATKRAALDDVEKLTRREVEAILFIVDYNRDYGIPPSQRELFNHLNSVLPKQKDGRPALVSTEQTNRIATKLRMKGFLAQVKAPHGVRVVHRNMVPTAYAMSQVKQLRKLKPTGGTMTHDTR